MPQSINCRVGCPESEAPNTKTRAWSESRKMEAMPSRCLFLLFLSTCKLSPEVVAEVQESSGKRKEHLSDQGVKLLLGEGKGILVELWVFVPQT